MKCQREFFYNKVIDVHTHYGMMLSSFFDDKIPASQNLLGLMEMLENDISNCAVVFPFPNKFIGYDVLPDTNINKLIRDAFDKIPYKLQNEKLLLDTKETGNNLFMPFLMFSLAYSVDEQIKFIKEKLKSDYVYGLKYYADTDNISLSNFLARGKNFIEFILKEDLPITFHVSADTVMKDGGLSYPNDILKISKQYPELRICIAHMAHFSKYIFNELSSGNYPNVYIDTSPFLHLCNIRNVMKSENSMSFNYDNPVEVLYDCVNIIPENIIWGSDYPFNFTCNLTNEFHNKNFKKFSIKKNNEILLQLPKETQRLITNTNTLNFIFGKE